VHPCHNTDLARSTGTSTLSFHVEYILSRSLATIENILTRLRATAGRDFRAREAGLEKFSLRRRRAANMVADIYVQRSSQTAKQNITNFVLFIGG